VTKSTGPLAGIRVIDITTGYLVPMHHRCSATWVRCDQGGDHGWRLPRVISGRRTHDGVIFRHVEPQQTQPAIDLNVRGNGGAVRLIDTADVFVHNMRIGAAQRLAWTMSRCPT